jgi:acyl carrier protein
VREAVVVPYQEPGAARSAGLSQARLVAYVVPEVGAGAEAIPELRSALAARLPDYMLPAAFVAIANVPLTPNGKVDRKALPAPDAGAAPGADYVAPRDGVEERIAGIWQTLLSVPRVGIHDNFFALGGHSLLATRVTAALSAELGVEVPLRLLFEKPTVAELALAVAEIRLAQAGTEKAAQLLDALEGLSDEEVERLLAEEDEA